MKALSIGAVAGLAGLLLPQGAFAEKKATQSVFNCHTSYGHNRVKKVARSTVSTTSTRTDTVTVVVHPTVEVTPDALTETETALVTITTTLPQATDIITETLVKKTDLLVTAEDTCHVVRATHTVTSTTTGTSTIGTVSGWSPIRSSWPEPSSASGGKQHSSWHSTHTSPEPTTKTTTPTEPTGYPVESTTSQQTTHTEPTTHPVEPTTSSQPTEPTGYPTQPTEPTGYPTGPTVTEPTSYPTGPTTTEPTGYPTGSTTTEPTGYPTSPTSTESTSCTDSSSSTTTEPTGYPTGPTTTEPTGYPTGPTTTVPSSSVVVSPTTTGSTSSSSVPTTSAPTTSCSTTSTTSTSLNPYPTNGWSYAEHQKRAEAVHKARMLPDVELNEGTGSPPNNYSSHSVECVKILFNFVTTTVTSTAKHTKTVVPECTSDLTTTTVTNTITKTMGSASSTVTETTTFTNTVVQTGGSTKVTAHATVTEYHLHARATHYAQCDKSNMMSTWNGLGINYIQGEGDYHYKFGIATPYDCCVACALDPGCKASAFDPENNFCAVVDNRKDTCDVNGKKMTGVLGSHGHSGHYQVISNGACGYVSS